MAEKARVACLLSGNGTTMSALLFQSRLPDCPYEIVLVASNNPDAGGLKIAAAEGIATFSHSHRGMDRVEHEAIIDAALQRAGAEYVALCGYMRILTEGFVESWAGRMVNTHPSLLPKYKGLDTHQRAIDAGDAFGGCSVHVVTPELDGGPLLGQMPVAILPSDTADSLAARVILAEYQLYPRTFAAYVSRQYRADWLLERVRELALAQPEAEERESHGSPAWRTAGKSGKFFAHFSDTHHGSDHIGVLVKTGGVDEVEGLVETAPQTYFKPAYYGASGWVGIILNKAGVDWDHVSEWLDRSWQSVAPKRLTKLRDAAAEF
ncbi:phosphoribosylglycinamide formyltransferase [Aurantiacibacter gangjinensis]|uniref:Phosphoribosylglycinamide formyltransferase n=1 Tax=Aurantiacibacter gangjinensis TaxID=502682 RepID=A0A0G9MRE1_9SPHN|nr:phosphoribosylglycinamide formyltransferase [Aurantiacibacter gangjinensis]APE26833.1 Phosphoribosylglycinamide formyltransferase [Aurantiacibacter gangjinensis]KLE33311.1 phosphoribosylglycinamide formyltransferase [Aurantiacibacter gangjinensis]